MEPLLSVECMIDGKYKSCGGRWQAVPRVGEWVMFKDDTKYLVEAVIWEVPGRYAHRVVLILDPDSKRT